MIAIANRCEKLVPAGTYPNSFRVNENYEAAWRMSVAMMCRLDWIISYTAKSHRYSWDMTDCRSSAFSGSYAGAAARSIPNIPPLKINMWSCCDSKYDFAVQEPEGKFPDGSHFRTGLQHLHPLRNLQFLKMHSNEILMIWTRFDKLIKWEKNCDWLKTNYRKHQFENASLAWFMQH